MWLRLGNCALIAGEICWQRKVLNEGEWLSINGKYSSFAKNLRTHNARYNRAAPQAKLALAGPAAGA